MHTHLPRAVCVWLLVQAFIASARAEDWPQFRGPNGAGISSAKGVPVEWDTSKNVAWKTEVPGRGWSSPVIVAGRVYLTTATGEGSNLSLRAMCVNANTGKVLWDTEVFRPEPAASKVMHKKNSQASPTPIVDGGRLYAHFGHLGTAALDLSGKVLWRQVVAHPPAHGNGGSPVLVDGRLVFNCDGTSDPFVVALDAETGDVRWRTPRNTPAKMQFSVATPQAIELNGVKQVVSPGSGFVGGYDPKDGRELWRVRYGEGYSVITQPAFAHGLLVLSSGYDSPVTVAIRADAAAAGDVTETNIAWQTKKAAPNTPSPLVVGDELYLVSDKGIVTCSDVRTGKVHWSERLDGNFSASPLFADGRVYFQSEEGIGYVVKAGKSFELLAENDLEEASLASYAIADRALYIRTAKHLWKIAR